MPTNVQMFFIRRIINVMRNKQREKLEFLVFAQRTMNGTQFYPLLTNQLTDPLDELKYLNILRWKTSSAGKMPAV